MRSLQLDHLLRRPANVERSVRTGIALSFVVGLAGFYVWFIVTHFVRYGG